MFGVLFLELLPFKLVARSSWVDSHEPFSVLDVCAQTVKLNDLVLGIDWSHVLLLPLSVGGGRQFKVDDWSFSDSVDLDDQRFFFRTEVPDCCGQNP